MELCPRPSFLIPGEQNPSTLGPVREPSPRQQEPCGQPSQPSSAHPRARGLGNVYP